MIEIQLLRGDSKSGKGWHRRSSSRSKSHLAWLHMGDIPENAWECWIRQLIFDEGLSTIGSTVDVYLSSYLYDYNRWYLSTYHYNRCACHWYSSYHVDRTPIQNRLCWILLGHCFLIPQIHSFADHWAWWYLLLLPAVPPSLRSLWWSHSSARYCRSASEDGAPAAALSTSTFQVIPGDLGHNWMMMIDTWIISQYLYDITDISHWYLLVNNCYNHNVTINWIQLTINWA